MSSVSEILKDVRQLFENNKRARIIQIKNEEKIMLKISELKAEYKRPERSGGCLDMEWPE